MPSTRKQKAKESRSRQLDMLSDVENVDIMLGSYSREDEENNISDNEVNLDSGSSRPQQSSNLIGEDFRSLLYTNSRENSEIAVETTRLINEEISNQMSRKLNEIKTSLNSQIQDAIAAAITSTVLPSFQNTLELQGRPDFTMVDRGSNGLHPSPRSTDFTIKDRRSSGLQRNTEVGNSHKTWENRPKTCYSRESNRLRSRESSTDSVNSEQNCDNYRCSLNCMVSCTFFSDEQVLLQRDDVFVSRENSTKTRHVLRGDINVGQTRLKKSNEDIWVISSILFQYFIRLVNFDLNSEFISVKKALTD